MNKKICKIKAENNVRLAYSMFIDKLIETSYELIDLIIDNGDSVEIVDTPYGIINNKVYECKPQTCKLIDTNKSIAYNIYLNIKDKGTRFIIYIPVIKSINPINIIDDNFIIWYDCVGE